jgi:Xaa-Pro dipeptidase
MFLSDAIEKEYSSRMDRAHSLMDRERMDALMLFTGLNLIYFTGATGMLGGRSGSRPFIYILPRSSEPVIIVHDGRQHETRRLTNVKDIRTYSRLSSLPLEAILDALDDLHLRKSKIGVELGREMVIDLPFSEYVRLKDELPNTKFVDASSLLWQLRMKKSPMEINWIAKACEITSKAYSKTFSNIKAGMTEYEIELMMSEYMLVNGGKAPWVLITSGEGNYDLVSKGGSSRKLRSGDMIWMDAGCSYNGYCSDFSRAGVIGGPTALQEEDHQKIHELTLIGMEMLKPGVVVSTIARQINEEVNLLDIPITSDISGLAGRVGHGMGMFITEPPSLSEDDDTVLEPGMILTIEPGIATKYGTFHVEEDVLVTENEPRLLSSSHWRLWNI